MAFKASNILPVTSYEGLKRRITILKSQLEAANADMLAGPIDYEFIHILYSGISGISIYLDEVKSTPGLSQHAKDQENDQDYNVVAEFVSLESSVDSALLWMQNNIPLSVTLTPIQSWSTQSRISNTFNTAQTAALRSQIQAIINSIE